MVLRLSAALVEAVAARPPVGAVAQAFPFVTVAEDGVPHVTLLSSRELVLDAEAGEVHAVLAGRTAPANLAARPQATLVVVAGDAAHSLSLEPARTVPLEGVVGVALAVTAHRGDSIGIPLVPLGYEVTPELPGLERWDRSARVLAAVAAGRTP